MATAARRVEIPLPHRRAGHCGSGAYRDLLEFHRLSWFDEPLSEGMVFGLGAGLGFAYVELEQMEPPLYIVGRNGDLERDICTHLGISLDFVQTDDPELGWAVLRDELDAGRPTMIWADIRELEYLRVRLQMTMHDIVVTGYDENEGVAFIADNDRDEIQRCSLEALARARNSQGFPAPNRHATYVTRFPESLPDAEPTIRRSVGRAVEQMAGGGDSRLGSSERNLGLAGIDKLSNRFERWPELFGGKLDRALTALRVYIVKAGTGGALFRSLQAEFLRDSERLLGSDSLGRAAGVYDELAELWREIAVRATVTDGDDAAAAHATCAPLVARACELEPAGVEAMEAWLASG